jgi:hypothetical protein
LKPTGGFSNKEITPISQNTGPNLKAPTKKDINQNNFSNNQKPSIDYVANVDLDLTPENYPKKFQKFVSELRILLENIKFSNEMIDNADYKQKTLDENVRLVVSNLRDLASNLVL